jgi:hypothetical protein
MLTGLVQRSKRSTGLPIRVIGSPTRRTQTRTARCAFVLTPPTNMDGASYNMAEAPPPDLDGLVDALMISRTILASLQEGPQESDTPRQITESKKEIARLQKEIKRARGDPKGPHTRHHLLLHLLTSRQVPREQPTRAALCSSIGRMIILVRAFFLSFFFPPFFCPGHPTSC